MLDQMALGIELCEEDRRHVLAAYVHRYTRDHVPQWARSGWTAANMAYPLQFDSDEDWLRHTLFFVRKDGRLDLRHHYCRSDPTWPDNPELRRSTEVT